MSTFSERVEQARIARGMSRQELSRRSGLSLHAIQVLYERDSSPRLENAIAIGDALEVDHMSLFTGRNWTCPKER